MESKIENHRIDILIYINRRSHAQKCEDVAGIGIPIKNEYVFSVVENGLTAYCLLLVLRRTRM